jgi:hypothetical protein
MILRVGTPLDEIIDEDSEEKYTFKGNIYLDDENQSVQH